MIRVYLLCSEYDVQIKNQLSHNRNESVYHLLERTPFHQKYQANSLFDDYDKSNFLEAEPTYPNIFRLIAKHYQ